MKTTFKQTVGVILIPLLLSACASVHSNHMAKQTSGDSIDGLIVSAEDISSSSDDPFSMIVVNFENRGDKWIRLEKAEVIIGEDLSDKVSVVLGKDLKDWSMASESKMAMDRHNRGMKQILWTGVITGAAIAGNSYESYTYGLAGINAVEAWIMTDAILASKNLAQNPKAVSENHIQSGFSVPGKLFLRKWVLLNKPTSTRVTQLPLKLSFVDGRTSSVVVDLKKVTK